jgi:hypothetical protein
VAVSTGVATASRTQAQPEQRAFSITADTSAVPTGTSGTRPSPTETAAPEAKTIIDTLALARDVDLKTHIGQIVEITGIQSLSEAVTTTDSSRGGAQAKIRTCTDERADATVEMTAPAEIAARTLNVTRVKTVAADCQPPK